MLTQTTQGPDAPVGVPIRYRTSAEERWRAGESVKIDHSDLMFLCEDPIELHSDIEVMLPGQVSRAGRVSPRHLLCSGRVVRRLLGKLPDVRSAFVVKVFACRIATDQTFGEA